MSEVRPIDANALLKEMRNLPNYETFEFDTDVDIYMRIVKHASTLDYTPVVRCKDCEHFVRLKNNTFCTKNAKTEFDIDTGAHNWFGLFKVNENHFCSYGAKMDEEVK